MKKLLALAAGSLLLSGCVVTPLPPTPPGPPGPGPGVRTCVVQDGAGRTWRRTSAQRPCVQAHRACNRWHERRGSRNWRCTRVKLY